MILFVAPFLLMYKVFYLLFCIFADICDFIILYKVFFICCFVVFLVTFSEFVLTLMGTNYSH